MAAINSNGVLDFSQPQEQPFVNTQVPPETYKTGTSIGTNPALNITPTMMNKKPVPETKGVYCPYINKLYAHNNNASRCLFGIRNISFVIQLFQKKLQCA